GQPVGHLVRRHAARDQSRSIVAPHGIGFDRAFLCSEITDKRFQDICVRNEALEVSVLVVDEGLQTFPIPPTLLTSCMCARMSGRSPRRYASSKSFACTIPSISSGVPA